MKSGMRLKTVAALACCLAAAGCGGGARDEVQGAALAVATLICDREWLTPGEGAELGVIITLQKGWHTYSDPPGDSGMAPILRPRLPEGVTAGKPLLPPHETFKDEAGTTLGYEREVMFRIPLTVGGTVAAGGVVEFGVSVQYLVCKESCVPQAAELSIQLPVRGERAGVTEAWQEAAKRGGWARKGG